MPNRAARDPYLRIAARNLAMAQLLHLRTFYEGSVFHACHVFECVISGQGQRPPSDRSRSSVAIYSITIFKIKVKKNFAWTPKKLADLAKYADFDSAVIEGLNFLSVWRILPPVWDDLQGFAFGDSSPKGADSISIRRRQKTSPTRLRSETISVTIRRANLNCSLRNCWIFSRRTGDGLGWIPPHARFRSGSRRSMRRAWVNCFP